MSDQPTDPFVHDDELWTALELGSTLFAQLEALETPEEVTRAIGVLSEHDLRCLALERVWRGHAEGMSQPDFHRWQLGEGLGGTAGTTDSGD